MALSFSFDAEVERLRQCRTLLYFDFHLVLLCLVVPPSVCTRGETYDDEADFIILCKNYSIYYANFILAILHITRRVMHLCYRRAFLPRAASIELFSFIWPIEFKHCLRIILLPGSLLGPDGCRLLPRRIATPFDANSSPILADACVSNAHAIY